MHLPTRSVDIVDGETGTYKTSKCKDLGGDVDWRDTRGHSDTRPEDVRIVHTAKRPMLDPMGRNDTHDNGISIYDKHSNLQVLRLIVGACQNDEIRHLSSYQLHVRASTRMLQEFRRTLADVSAFLEGNLGYLVVLVVGCMDPNEMTGVVEILKSLPSKNGPATAVPLYPAHHGVPSTIEATGKFVKLKDGDHLDNWSRLETYLPKLDPFEFVFKHEHCGVCGQRGDHRLMGPCHKGPVQREHAQPHLVRRHDNPIIRALHGQPKQSRGSEALGKAAPLVAPLSILAYGAITLGLELLSKTNCSECHRNVNSEGCIRRYACCNALEGSDGCREIQQCSSCQQDLADSEGCTSRCMACNREPQEAESGCDHFNTVKHDIGT